MWLSLALSSALLLGTYDIFKKYSLKNNAVLPVLLTACLSGMIFMLPFYGISLFSPDILKPLGLFVAPLSFKEHFLTILKSILVVTSWILAYFALRNLPITIVSPIRATAPLWTLTGAIIIFGERLNPIQWIGIIVTLTFFFLFSVAGKKEGIEFRTNKWIWCIIVATLLGAASSLYDKYLLKSIDRMGMQMWFSIYQVVIMVPVTFAFWWPKRKAIPFKWKWTIPLIGIFLVLADFTYFYALSEKESLVSVVSAIRRSGVLVAFTFGAILFKEKNLKTKGLFLLGILAGIIILMLSK